MGSWRSAAAGITAALVCPTVAVAQGDICLDLQSRLVQIERAGGPGSVDGAREYDASVGQQRNEIDRAMAEARRAGCVGGFLIFQPRAEPKCPQLMATIDRMRANLERLMRARNQAGGDPFALTRERGDVLAQLARYGCGPQYAARGGGFQQPGGLFESLFGQARFRFPGNGGFMNGGGFGAYRTLCVRACDGYYFPISFSTMPAKFAADAATCQQMCPGTAAELYIHRNPGEETTQMVSLNGMPYTALPTAFRYRQEYDKSCSCGTPTAPMASLAPVFTEFSTAATSPATIAPPAPSSAVPMPHLRPAAAGEDPETAANRRGNLKPGSIQERTPETFAEVTSNGRKVRIVGPVDFYAQ